MNITRVDLISFISVKMPGETKENIAKFLAAAIQGLTDGLIAGHDIQLRGFGTFRVARVTRGANHLNAENLRRIRKTVRFRPASDLIKRL